MLRIRLLGGLALELDGEEVAPPAGRPARALLGWLALHPGEHARGLVAARLWPHVLDSSARTSLRSALAALRSALGEASEQVVVATRERIGLRAAPVVWVDVVAFDALAASDRMEEALDLSVGELLPELDDDWVHEARDAHRQRRAAALSRAAASAEARGDLDGAIGRSRELVELDPLAEEAQRALIRRLAAAGDRSAALTTYSRFRDRVRRELGTTPGHETRAMVEGLRSGDADDAAAGDHIIDPPLPPALNRFQGRLAGRRSELARLAALWGEARRGGRRLALVAGEPGIGKTRLVAELARGVGLGGGWVLYGRAYEDPLIAYQPFVEALRPWLSRADAVDGQLARLVPGLVDRPEGWSGGDPEGVRFRLFESVSSVLASASRRRPILAVLDDLHWADKSTLLLLGHLLRAPDPARLLVVGTYRDTDLPPDHPLAALLVDGRRDGFGDRLRLRGLDEPEVEELVRDATGGPVPLDLVSAVHRRTDGNPFFVEELLRDFAEAGAPESGSARSVERIRVPEGVKELIGRRLARLGREAEAVLARASVLGRDVELAALAGLVDDGGFERALEVLERAAAAGLVRDEPGAVGRYGFAHALVRESLYEGLDATRRARFHARAAAALERLHGDAPDRLGEIAHHLLSAAEPAAVERGAWAAMGAAEVALGQLGYDEAAAHLERALDALGRARRLDPLRRCEILLALGDACMRAGETAPGRRAFAAAAAAARRLDRADLLARAAHGFGGIGVTIAAPDGDVVALLEEALATLGDAERPLRARLLARLAIELYYAPDRDRTEALSAQAVELATEGGDGRTLSEVLSARHVALWTPEGLHARLAVADEMLELARRTDDRVALLQARNWRILDLFEIGDVAAVRSDLEVYGRLAAEVRLPAYTWYEPMWRATLAILEGRLEEAGRLATRARELGRGAANAELFFRIQREHLLLERGEPGRVLELLQGLIRGSSAGAAHRSGLALLFTMLGRREEAQAELDDLGAGDFGAFPRDANWLPSLAIMAEAVTRLGDRGHAAQLYALLLPHAGHNVVDARATYCYGSAHHPLALLASTLSRPTAALEHGYEALAFHREVGAGPLLCRTLGACVDALLARGGRDDRARARRLAAEGLERARELAIPHLVTGAATVAARAGA